MKTALKKILIPLAFAINIGITLFGFATLLASPYTGIRMNVCGDHACVKDVDKGSPAYGKVQAGDRFVDIAGLNITCFAFNIDPDYIHSERDLAVFWESIRKLNEAVKKDKPVEISLSRVGQPLTVSVTPVGFPFLRALARPLPIYLAGWSVMIVAYLVLRKKNNETSIAFMVLGFVACANFAATIPFGIRDVAFPLRYFKAASFVDLFTVLLIAASLLHLVLVFPRKKKMLDRRAWIVPGLYCLVPAIIALRLSKIFDNTHLTSYLPLSIGILSVSGALIFSFIVEKDAIVRKQVKWVVFGTMAMLVIYAGLTSIPVMFGAPIVSAEISALVAVLMPLSFAFAITKYKLMAIDDILDTAVIYGFTILILAGVETTFLSFASPYLLTAGKGLPAFSVVAVLLIVFIYVPIRNFVKGMVERLFKRGKYDPEKELQQFTVSLGLCDERSALEKFTAFVKSLLKPSGIVVFKIEEKEASVLHASNDFARQEGERLVPKAGKVWEHVRSKGTCTFGYELSEKIGQDGVLAMPDLENALFVPFITDPTDPNSGYLAVLLKKWNETAYSIKDVTLLNAISVNIANIIEAGELRKERAEIEERLRKEKDAVMKELHDGLGNILTSITVTTQAAERMLEGAKDKAGELVGRINAFSSEATDFLRTGLTVLDNPRGDIGSMLEAIKDRFASLFEAAGMELRIECADEAKKLRPGAMIAMNLTGVIQEALSNIMRHSAAKRVEITLGKQEDRIEVMVSDDGRVLPATGQRAGLGIGNMKRRMEQIQGSLRIDSYPGRGTEIRLSFSTV